MKNTQFYPAKTKASSVTGSLSVVNGGTDADNASDARANLGLAVGVDVQAYDPDLSAISALSDTATGYLKKTGANTWTLSTPTTTITLTGDVTGSGTSSIATTLSSSGVTAGTYKSVTVDVKGRVTSGTNPTTISGFGITDAVTTSGAQTIAGVKTFTSNPLLSGGGIQFPATQISSSDPNTLSDFERGTWTPSLSASTAPTGVTYSYRGGRYVKIDNTVFVQFGIKISSAGSGGSGEVTITGLPFTSASYGSFLNPTNGITAENLTTASYCSQLGVFVGDSSTTLTTRLRDGGDAGLPYSSQITSTTVLAGQIFYNI